MQVLDHPPRLQRDSKLSRQNAGGVLYNAVYVKQRATLYILDDSAWSQSLSVDVRTFTFCQFSNPQLLVAITS